MTQTVVEIWNFKRALKGYPKKVAKFGTVVGLTRTAKGASEQVKHEIARRFGRPTPFTRRAPKFTPAKKAKPVARVGFRSLGEGRKHYLAIQETGGTVKPKREAIVIPTEKRRNRYGNLPRGAVRRMLANKTEFFSGVPFKGARPGIYQRMGGKRSRKLRLAVAYEDEATYRPHFGFRESVTKYVRVNVGRHFAKAFAEFNSKEARRL